MNVQKTCVLGCSAANLWGVPAVLLFLKDWGDRCAVDALWPAVLPVWGWGQRQEGLCRAAQRWSLRGGALQGWDGSMWLSTSLLGRGSSPLHWAFVCFGALPLHHRILRLIALLQSYPLEAEPHPKGLLVLTKHRAPRAHQAQYGPEPHPFLPHAWGKGFQSATQMQQFPSMRIPHILFSAENVFPCEQEGGECKECAQQGLKGVAQASVTNAGRKKCSLFCSQVGWQLFSLHP